MLSTLNTMQDAMFSTMRSAMVAGRESILLPSTFGSHTRSKQMTLVAREIDDAYLVSLAAPGVSTDDLTVKVSGGRITIEGYDRAKTNEVMKVSVDGFLGPRTILAVQSFLKQQGLEVGPMDGVLGKRTVSSLQEFLTTHSLDVGPIDGRFGRRTARALQKWLHDLDVCAEGFSIGPIDGLFGPRSVVALQMSLNALPIPTEHDCSFSREIELPRDADLQSKNVNVTHENGLLTVSVPKVATKPVRTLEINGAQQQELASRMVEAEDNQVVSDVARKADAALELRDELDEKARVLFAEVEEKHDSDWEHVVSKEEELKSRLADEGLVDEEMVAHIIALHGTDAAEACLEDARRLSAWTPAVEDLVEMGFEDVTANRKALLKHDGSIKAVVKELVAKQAQP